MQYSTLKFIYRKGINMKWRICILVLLAGLLHADQWIEYLEASIMDLDYDDHYVYVATEKGLYIINKKTNEQYLYTSSNSELPSNLIYNLSFADSIIWLSTIEHLLSFDGENWTIHNPGNINWFIYDLLYDNGVLWIGSDHGLVKYNGENWEIFNSDNSGFPTNKMWNLTNADSALWIGTYEGLIKFDGINCEVFNSENSTLPVNPIRAVHYDGQILWVGTDYGLLKYDGTNWEHYLVSNSGLPDNRIITLEYGNGILWVGTFYGLGRYDGANWSCYDYRNSAIAHELITSLAVDRDILWIGSMENLVRLNYKELNIINVTPVSICLYNNYPNPFNSVTYINYTLNQTGHVKLTVTDISGRIVDILIDKQQNGGKYTLSFEGSGLVSGMYVCRLESGNIQQSQKMILLK
ncbi:MAG TPA: hypothetical protein DCX03_11555 [Bacteroidales bacterium]|jgi:ligand-binding sensor domain-containing protein|nr:hypothetical protein [Bacteroidales bacterium]